MIHYVFSTYDDQKHAVYLPIVLFLLLETKPDRFRKKNKYIILYDFL